MKRSTHSMPWLILLLTLPIIWVAALEPPTAHQRATAALTFFFLGVAPALGASFYARLPRFPENAFSRYGQSRRRLALKQQTQSTVLLSLACAIGLGAALFAAYGGLTHHAMADLARTLPIGLSAAIALSGTFALAHAWAGRLGILVLLISCWLAAPEAATWSRAVATSHLRELLGAGKHLTTPGWLSHASLLALGVVGKLLATWRVPR